MYTVIDMAKDPRAGQYALFTTYSNPFLSVTADVDVTDLVRFCRERHFSFYAGMTRLVLSAANRVPELRRRIVGGEVREYDQCEASIIEMGAGSVYYYCMLESKESWEAFIPYAQVTRAAHREHPILEEEAEELFYISCLPTLRFSEISLPHDPQCTNPMFTWGKFEQDSRGRYLLPLNVSCHHGLIDGYHLEQFFRILKEELAGLPQSV